MSPKVSELNCYPVKSCRGFSLPIAEIDRMGIRFDRQWMVIDEHGMFVAQRGGRELGVGVKTMCLIETATRDDDLVITAPDMPQLTVPLAGREGELVEARIWKSTCTAVNQGHEADAWFTKFLSRERLGKYRLVRMADNGIRKAKHGEGQLAFADGYAFLIVSQPSLDDLNRRMPAPLVMNRFRPNIVITGCEPYDEDRIARMRIGGIEFRGTTLCVRCRITVTNQLTAEYGQEPLRTLATYRKKEDGVVFGRNFNHSGRGTISVGDSVEILDWD